MSDKPPPASPTCARAAAVLWMVLGTALVGGAVMVLIGSDFPQRLVEESGILAAVGTGTGLLVLGILTLTSVLPGTVGMGIVTVSVVAITVIPFFLDMPTCEELREFDLAQLLIILSLSTALLAGVFALVGGAAYRLWRQARRCRREPSSD